MLDTIGELVRAYQLATVVFVGGSFGRRGGQNILEPAACGKPVLFGPRMENFQDSVQVLVGRGGLQVKDSGGAPAADARSAGASGRAAQAGRARARRGLLGARRLARAMPA